MKTPTLLVDNIEDFLPTHSVWDTAGGCDELATAVFLRGSILSSYGYIETQLNDLALRASHIPALNALSPEAPRIVRDRMAFLKKCFDAFEPLSSCRDDWVKLIDEFLEAQPDRNDWAHGRLVVKPGHTGNRWYGSTIKLEICSPGRKLFQVGNRKMLASDLVQHAKRTRVMAQRSQNLHMQAAELLPDH